MQPLPHAGLLPVPEAPSARHPGAVAQLLRQVAPRDPGREDEQDPAQAAAVVDARPAGLRRLARGQQRLNDRHSSSLTTGTAMAHLLVVMSPNQKFAVTASDPSESGS